jgi:hypothetical protein
MSDPDLGELWAASDAPAYDLAFTLAVEERIARRLMLIDVAGRIGAGLALVAALVAFGPALLARLAALAGSVDAAGPVLAAVAVLGAVMVRLMRTGEGFQDLEDGGGSPSQPS